MASWWTMYKGRNSGRDLGIGLSSHFTDLLEASIILGVAALLKLAAFS